MIARLLPPRPALLLGLALTGPLLVLCAVVVALGAGGASVLGLVLGFTAGLVPAVAGAGPRLLGPAAALTVGAGALGLAAAGSTGGTAAGVALAALAAAPLNQRVAGAGTMLPVLVAVTGSVGLDAGAAGLASWLLAGFGLVVLLGRLLRVEAPVPGVPAAVARRHAVATAVTAGGACWLVLAWGVEHGYWLVLAAATILRPVPGESSRLARDRVAGTLVGVLTGVVGVLVLPPTASIVVALAVVPLLAACALAQDQRMLSAASTVLVLLTSSGGFTAGTVALALDRVLLTLAGAAVAVLAARWLHRADAPAGPAEA